MPVLSCPRCALTVPVDRAARGEQECPRCLARTSGALSVPLAPGLPDARAQGRSIIARLMRDRGRLAGA
jgi:hypothetical protein